MKKYSILLAVILFAIGCQKDNNDNLFDTTDNTIGLYNSAITIDLGTNGSRGSFDNDLKWSWSASDKIIGYQNDGSKTRNILTHEEESTFSCNKFTYATEQPAKFHFIYPASAEQDDKTLVATQNGKWDPILVGTTPETDIQNIGTVAMQHLSSALEIRAAEGTTILAATLSSSADFVGCWTVNDDLTYNQALKGNSIAINGLSSQTVVFNMPVMTATETTEKAITLTITTSTGDKEYTLPAMPFAAGKRTIFNLSAKKTALLNKNAFNNKVRSTLISDNSIIAIKFIANSNDTSSTEVQDSSSDNKIYLIVKGTTLEVHTAAQEFITPADCSGLFDCNYVSGLARITSIDLSNFNTSNATNMEEMFNGCTALEKIVFSSSFDTSKVKTMKYMFSNCNALKELDLSSFNTSEVTNMGSMFYNCKALTTLDLSNLKTSKVENMSYMFEGCEKLETLNLSGNFDTSNVTTILEMFYNCYALKKLDLSNFKTSNVANMDKMFYGCTALEEIVFSNNFNTSNVKTMESLFSGCNSLKALDLSSFSTSKLTSMRMMFCNCYALEKINLSSFDTQNITNMDYMFYNCYALKELDLSGFDFSKVGFYAFILSKVGDKYKDTGKITVWVSSNAMDDFWSGKSIQGNYKIDNISNKSE